MTTEATTIGIRELKAQTSKVLRQVKSEQKEIIITNHGRPCGKLVPVDEDELEKKPSAALRGAYTDLPDLDEELFDQLKQAWVADV